MSHIHEKIDYAVDVYIVCKNKVLLRLHDKYNKWLAVGGHVELDEDPNQAAYREVDEEVGKKVRIVGAIPKKGTDEYTHLIPPRFMNIHPINETHQHISLIYFATAEDEIVIPENKDDQWKWVTYDELEGMGLSDTIKFYAQTALQELSH